MEYRKASRAMFVIAAVFAILAVRCIILAASSFASGPTGRFHTRFFAVFAAGAVVGCIICFVFAFRVRTSRWIVGAWLFSAGGIVCCLGAIRLSASVGVSRDPGLLMIALSFLFVWAFMMPLMRARAYRAREIKHSRIVRSEGWLKNCDICENPLTEDDPDGSPYCEGCFHLLRWARAHFAHALPDVETITPDTTSNELCADCLEHIELVLEAEEKFNIKVSERRDVIGIDPFMNIRELLCYLRSHGAVWPADHDIEPVTGRCIIWKYVKGWKVVNRDDPQHKDNTAGIPRT